MIRKNKIFSAFITLIISAVVIVILFLSYKKPPEIILAKDLSTPIEIENSIGNYTKILNINDREIWNKLDFILAKEEYPGETPDFIINLVTEKSHYTALYNKNAEVIFFLFGDEIKYTLFNKPPTGG